MSDSISVSVVDKWLNFQLICKPEQSGKTFIMIQHIIKDLSDPMPGKEIINFILCDNNLLLTQQTSGRVKKDLSQAKKDISLLTHQGEYYIELSSHSRTNYHGVDAVFTAILDPRTNARNIICCTNGTRMEDIARLITLINSTIFTSDKFHFNIWLDEADKFTKFIDATLWPIVETYSNVNVKLITATPQPLFQKYKYMNVLPIENTTADEYHGWGDNSIRIIEKDGGCQVFVDHVLSKVAPEAIQAGTKWFIPGLSAKKSHEDIKNVCVSKGMAVICVNSDGIILTLPETLECVKYSKDDEFNSKIIEIYTENHLERFAVVITGYICIGRGITIMSENFMIDYAILSHYSNKNEASQLAGRVKGNIKGYSSYNKQRPPIIFTKEEFNRIAIEWEHKSRTLARLAFQKKQNGQLTVVNKAEFKTCVLNAEDEIEIPDPKTNVPIVLPMSLDIINIIHGYKTPKKRLELRKMLKEYLIATNKQSLAERIDGFEVSQITRPDSEGSRKRNIDDPVKAAQNNKLFSLNVKHKDKDSWQAVFDDNGMQIIFILYCNP
jgi:hypothetical protein